MHVGQAEVAADAVPGELSVIIAEPMHDCAVQVVDGDLRKAGEHGKR